jgi:hypothetical protein
MPINIIATYPTSRIEPEPVDPLRGTAEPLPQEIYFENCLFRQSQTSEQIGVPGIAVQALKVRFRVDQA